MLVHRNKRKYSRNLKKLEPDTHGTGKWNFSGRNLPPDEVAQLTLNGVNWETDIMPDGRLKLPKFRKRRLEAILKAVKLNAESLAHKDHKRRVEYDAIPEPKPDYFAWAVRRDEQDHYARLEQEFYLSQLTRDRIKAMALLLEFAKSKPKQQLEVTNRESDIALAEPARLLQMVCELNGIDFNKVKHLAEAIAD